MKEPEKEVYIKSVTIGDERTVPVNKKTTAIRLKGGVVEYIKFCGHCKKKTWWRPPFGTGMERCTVCGNEEI